MGLYLPVSKMLSKVMEEIPIDLLVYSKPMFKKFIELNSMFSKEILQNGIVLYEADHERMVE